MWRWPYTTPHRGTSARTDRQSGMILNVRRWTEAPHLRTKANAGGHEEWKAQQRGNRWTQKGIRGITWKSELVTPASRIKGLTRAPTWTVEFGDGSDHLTDLPSEAKPPVDPVPTEVRRWRLWAVWRSPRRSSLGRPKSPPFALSWGRSLASSWSTSQPVGRLGTSCSRGILSLAQQPWPSPSWASPLSRGLCHSKGDLAQASREDCGRGWSYSVCWRRYGHISESCKSVCVWTRRRRVLRRSWSRAKVRRATSWLSDR